MNVTTPQKQCRSKTVKFCDTKPFDRYKKSELLTNSFRCQDRK